MMSERIEQIIFAIIMVVLGGIGIFFGIMAGLIAICGLFGI